MKEVCAVLLAAGRSNRMGTAKQLLNWKGQTLLKYQSLMKQAGHPVFIGNYQGLHWQSLKGDTGAKLLIQQVERKEFIDTNDIGITFDIDTPEAYQYAVENYL